MRSTMGVGPALRKARQTRGVTIAEASRDTKIRPELIRALEAEEFDRLLGDVYIRGALRSYSTYLGLPAERVVAAYAKVAGDEVPPTPSPPRQPDPVVDAPRRRDNHRLALMAAATVLILATAFGVLSTRQSAPPPARLPGSVAPAALGPGINLAVSTQEEVGVTVTVDAGPPRTFTLHPGEGREFVAAATITIRLSRGATADVVVSGRDLGTPGRSTRPWTGTFSYGTSSPAPSGLVSP